MPLRYLAVHNRYSTYLDDDGEEVLLLHGAVMHRLVDLDELVESDRFEEALDWASGRTSMNSRTPIALAQRFLIDLDERHRIVRCRTCDDWGVDYAATDDGFHLCPSCMDDAGSCSRCGGTYMHLLNAVDSDGDDIEVCGTCRDNYYSYCETCEHYYPDSTACPTQPHDESSRCCESPMISFSLPVKGGDRLPNDERRTVSIASVVDQSAITRVENLLWERRMQATEPVPEDNAGWDARQAAIDEAENLYYRVRTAARAIDENWKDPQGRTWSRRLASKLYKDYKQKLPTDLLARIGDMARDGSVSVDVEVEVTRLLNGTAEDFAYDDSCWWGGYAHSRCTLKSHGGFGLRSYSRYGVTGRAWVFPVERHPSNQYRLRPTFGEPEGYVVFNAYGDLEERVGVRVMAALSGWEYQRFELNAHAYINSDSAWLVAPRSLLDEARSMNRVQGHVGCPEVPDMPAPVAV